MQKYLAHLQLQQKRTFRNPGFWVPTILFPMMLYSFFGASLPPAGIYSQMAIASFAIYGVVGIGFYQFGVGVAQTREDPFDSWQRTLPASALSNALAQVSIATILALSAVLLVLLASLLFGKTPLSFAASLNLIAVCALVAIPATLMGIALGYSASAKAAPALANLIFLPLAFLGGLWIPPIQMPEVINNISLFVPTRLMGEFSWSAVAGELPHTNFILGLGAYTLGFALLVVFLVRRDRLKRFG